MTENYYFIDGSSLLAQIRTLQKKSPTYKERRLDILKLISYFTSASLDLGSEAYKRAVFYFPEGETTIQDFLIIPNFKKPGLVRDLHLKYCGKKIRGSKAFNDFVNLKVPEKYRDRFTKSEKGIDIEMCCDALRLAGIGKLERLFFLTNDSDFVPLCRTLKDFGANISLIHLSEKISPNEALLKQCDSYDTISENELNEMFLPTLQVKTRPELSS